MTNIQHRRNSVPFEKITAEGFARMKGAPSRNRANPEYVAFLAKLKPGEGGRVTVADEGVTRQQVKNRLRRAATITGRNIKFIASDAATVIFAVK
jgi:hypothetical protein